MRICYMANARSIHTYRWSRYFVENGHQVYLVSIISNNPHVDFEKENLSTKNLKIKKLKAEYEKIGVDIYLLDAVHVFAVLIALLKARQYVRKIKPDIVHAHYVTTNGFLGAFSGFHPFVLTAWGSDVLIDEKEWKRWLIKCTLKKADCITCDAEHMRDTLVELGANLQKISLIYFGTDTQKFKPKQKNEKLRKELGILDSPTVISLRNLTPIYDVESLITAIPLVLKEVPEAKFVIAGWGHQEEELKQLAKSLNVSDSVRFVGWIPNNELSKYLASADIYVSTSLSDAGLAASTAEAMACGLPVVITDFGNNRKWVEDGENGFIVPLKAPQKLAEKIVYLLNNPNVRKDFGGRNRKIIEERNNYYKEMEKTENIYIELIERYKS